MTKKKIGDTICYEALFSNSKKAQAVKMSTSEALSPYIDYLENAIKAQKQKGEYEIDFKIIEDKYQIEIRPIYSKFRVRKPKTILKIFLDGVEVKEERNKLFFDFQDKTKRFDKSELKIIDNVLYLEDLDILPKNDEILEFNNKEVKYELIEIDLKKEDELVCDNKKYKIIKIETLEDGWNVWLDTNKNLKEAFLRNYKLELQRYKEVVDVLFDGDENFICERVNKNIFSCNKLPKNKILKDENQNEYRWKEIKGNNKEIIVQLIDDDSDEKPISDYFFEDETEEVYQEEGKFFKIEKKNYEDKILILKKEYELDENKPLKIKVNISNLKRQKESIETLNSKPVKEQRNLIKLFEKKNSRLWSKYKIEEIDEWFVLVNERYDGTIEQRDFVKKALATKDFAILEGPPGSGKTTTILELILQLIKRGKKILLSASTHVAIDNVLERIKSYEDVIAVRVGREDSISEEIKEFQIDNKIKEYQSKGFSKELAEKLLLDSANLVCGTTMGIKQYPLIKNHDKVLPIEPIFDVMIIDESSKTTFNEFIVPALYAKKWILVGDIKQLSPYIEQSYIMHNLSYGVKKETQEAIRIVFETLYNSKNPYIVEVTKGVEEEIKKYLEYWEKKEDNPYKDKVVSFIGEKDLFKLLGSDLILIEEGSWEEVKEYMPRTHIVKLKEDKENDSFYFEQFYLYKKRKLSKFSKFSNNPIEAKEEFKKLFKKSWAEEIAWRMIRVYERRMLKQKDSYYEKTYELLKPVSEERDIVERIYNMSLPSVLESLQIGNGEKHMNQTTITDGFNKEDLKLRHTILKYQHRMHPDISKFSRENFYTIDDEVALLDSKTIDRSWNYNRYPKRSVWIDTPKSNEDKKNDRVHKKEADVIIREIEEFLKFVKDNPKKDSNNWSIAVLTFYRPQEKVIRERLRNLCHQSYKMSRFHKDGVDILLYTVDKFQGMEADVVFLSMVRGKSIGFMDNINRLNVALTRAKYQRVIVGDKTFFENKGSDELKKLAKEEVKYES